MPATAYATLDDLAQWVDGDLPVTAPNVLRSAGYAVADRISLAVYGIDRTTGLPTDPLLLTALKEATCSQAAWLIANDVDPLAGAAEATIVSSTKIGTAQEVYADAGAAAAVRAQGAAGLCLEAERIIQQAGFRDSIWERPSLATLFPAGWYMGGVL